MLPDGRALIAGGDLGGASGPYAPVAVCQLFRINSVTALAGTEIQVDYDSLAATALPVATTLANMTRGPVGTVLATNAVFTGGVAGAGAFKTAKKFDPVAGGGLGAWSALTDMTHVRCAHTQTVVGNKILVSGGATAAAGTVVGTAELYNPATNAWVDTASSMNVARCDHQAVLMSNGKVLVTGGRNLASGSLFYTDSFASITNTGPILSSCEFYQPSDDSWRLTGPMTYARFQHALVLLPDGRILAIGGLGYNPTQAVPNPMTAIRDCEIYDPNTGRWSPAGRLSAGRATVIAALLADRSQVIVTGGPESRATDIFDVATGQWSTSPCEPPAYRPRAVGVLMANDLIFMTGGVNGNTTFVDNNINLYIPNQDKLMGGGLNGPATVASVTSPTVFTYLTEKTEYVLNASSTATITPFEAPASGKIPGPYMWDTAGGVAVTDKKSAIQSTLSVGHNYGSVDVANAKVFPDAEGWLVFNFGYEGQVGPVKYLGRLSDTTLSLDYGFKFTATVPSGALVTLLASKGTFVPEHPEQVGSFYLTASPAGRVAASAAIDGAVAAGVVVNKTIEYPGSRGLGNEEAPYSGSTKINGVVDVFAGDNIDAEVDAARNS